MEKNISITQEFEKYYLREFKFYDGEVNITFNIIDVNFEKHTITVAVTNRGKISVIDYDLYQDNNGNYYFEYSPDYAQIPLEEFEEIEHYETYA